MIKNNEFLGREPQDIFNKLRRLKRDELYKNEFLKL